MRICKVNDGDDCGPVRGLLAALSSKIKPASIGGDFTGQHIAMACYGLRYCSTHYAAPVQPNLSRYSYPQQRSSLYSAGKDNRPLAQKLEQSATTRYGKTGTATERGTTVPPDSVRDTADVLGPRDVRVAKEVEALVQLLADCVARSHHDMTVGQVATALFGLQVTPH